MASTWTVHLHAAYSFPLRILSDELQFRSELRWDCSNCMNWSRKFKFGKFMVRAVDSGHGSHLQNDAAVVQDLRKDDAQKARNPLAKLQESISSVPLFVNSIENFKFGGSNFTIGICIVVSMLVLAMRGYAARKPRYSRPGSVADLVRRGQLKSDRRGISTPLKYEDPFNNPMVKVSKRNSTVEMCGKVYKLAPVTLTDEQQNIHQRRRSRAYQWKRPTIFLKEGEPIPPDVDPDTVRWIPANHPFATTSSDMDEGLAQNNVYQKHGVPFRIKAEHEALQRKLEALQSDQKLNKLVIDPGAARDFERPLKMKPENQGHGGSNPPTYGNKQPSEESQNT